MRRLPLWSRWALALVLFGAVAIRLAGAFDDPEGSPRPDPAAEAEALRLGRVAVAQDQRPHSVALRARPGARRQLEQAIKGDVLARRRRGQLSGRVGDVRCSDGRRTSAERVAFSCTALVGGLRYPFVAVADRRARRLTWCKRNPSPDPVSSVPVAARCRR